MPSTISVARICSNSQAPDFELAAHDVVDEPLADAVRADEPLRVRDAALRERHLLAVARHEAVRLQPLQVPGLEAVAQGGAQLVHAGRAALPQLPQPFQHLFTVGDLVHSFSTPDARTRNQCTAPV